MKLEFTTYLKKEKNFVRFSAKNEEAAFLYACKNYGINNFSEIERYYPDQSTKDRKLYFLKRAISNISKHTHAKNRKGFKPLRPS